MEQQQFSTKEIFNAMDYLYKKDKTIMEELEKEVLALIRFCFTYKIDSDLKAFKLVMDRLGVPADDQQLKRVVDAFPHGKEFKPLFMLKYKYARDKYMLLTAMVDHLVGMAIEGGEDVQYYMNISQKLRAVSENRMDV